MRVTAEAIWRADGQRYTEFTVFIYMPGMDWESVAYGIGEFRRSGLKEFEVHDFVLAGTKWEQMKSKPKTGIKTQNKIAYHIDLNVTKTASRTINVEAATNFPDGSKFLVSVDREYHTKGDPQTYAGEIFDQDIAVRDGKVRVQVEVSDARWYREYQEKARSLPDLFTPIKTKSEEVRIRVLFSPMRSQPKSVLAVTGERGAYIRGPDAETSGDLTVYFVEKTVSIPFTNE